MRLLAKCKILYTQMPAISRIDSSLGLILAPIRRICPTLRRRIGLWNVQRLCQCQHPLAVSADLVPQALLPHLLGPTSRLDAPALLHYLPALTADLARPAPLLHLLE